MAMTLMTGDGGSPSNQQKGQRSDLLAPGFRFHPTDEELVSYYLKRKVNGRRLRVDAIAEVDIYRVEPWDLPAMSKLRSRDMEWYFFSTLDRKYSNRSRTNRATSEGYWKTTGKDRPVHDRHRSLLVGMKKTLVFHIGRAPKGQRTNWVMHEYRLHTSDNTDANTNPQEGYVVCRIFQKTAPGPQNGAQYGAPFMEEEWVEEDDEEQLVPPPKMEEVEEEEEEGAIGLTDNQYVQLDDFNCDQKEELVNQNEINALFAMDANGQNGETNSENPADLFEDIFDVDNYMNVPELQDDPNLMYNLGENSGLCAEYQRSPDPNDGYLELKDIFDDGNMGYPPNESSFDCLEGIFNDQILTNGVNEIPTFQEVDNDFFIGNGTETAEPQQLDQMCLPVEGDLDLQLDGSQNPVAAGDYHSGQQSEDNVVFYDAPNQDLPYPENNFVDTSAMSFLPVSDFDMVDDLIAYFDATETDFPYIQDPSENREFDSYVAQPNLAPEVEQNNSAACKEVGAASSAGLPEADKKFANVEKDVNEVPDAQRKESWNKSLTKHVVNMLGSISAPPAMAEDPGKQKAISLISASHASSSIHVSAGMIHVHGAVMESAEHWTLQKNGDIGFLLSYGMSGNDFEMNTKVQYGSMSMVLSGGFYLFGISMMILAVSLKVGMCLCNN